MVGVGPVWVEFPGSRIFVSGPSPNFNRYLKNETLGDWKYDWLKSK